MSGGTASDTTEWAPCGFGLWRRMHGVTCRVVIRSRQYRADEYGCTAEVDARRLAASGPSAWCECADAADAQAWCEAWALRIAAVYARCQTPALEAVAAERQRQDRKWGKQDHPGVDPVLLRRPGGCTAARMSEEYEIPTASRAQNGTSSARERGSLSWAHILVEEVAEVIEAATLAAQGRDSGDLRTELIQVAAVAVAWIEAHDASLTVHLCSSARATVEDRDER